VLSPMEVQYIVGLCCLRKNPEAVDVTLGDMVLDTASEKERDVDVTVTLEEGADTVRAFKAYEVKRERAPLDVVTVEQLCAKLKDMPRVTHPAIVSASGYTEAAIKKAKSHGVELYQLGPWTRPVAVDFPMFTLKGRPEDCLQFGRQLLVWLPGRRISLVAPKGPESFSVLESTPVLAADGSIHAKFAQMSVYWEELMLRSTTVLFKMDPAATMRDSVTPTVVMAPSPVSCSPAWPHSHTLDVGRDEVFLHVGGRLAQIEHVTISGHLQWQSEALTPDYRVMVRVPDGSVFAGAAVSAGLDESELMALMFSPESRATGIHRIRLTERQKNAIRSLKLLPKQPEP
jgi:hypothetical protein